MLFEEHGLTEKSLILLPTGDGIAIAILKPEPFDLALQVAQLIMSWLSFYNQDTPDPKRKFEVRAGINQNIDNLIIDINGNRNVAGRGINMAQRIMSLADGPQILVGEAVYDILCEREAYAGAFREIPGKDKPGRAMAPRKALGAAGRFSPHQADARGFRERSGGTLSSSR